MGLAAEPGFPGIRHPPRFPPVGGLGGLVSGYWCLVSGELFAGLCFPNPVETHWVSLGLFFEWGAAWVQWLGSWYGFSVQPLQGWVQGLQGWVQPLHGCTDGFPQGTVSSGGGQSPENLGDWWGGVSPGHGQQEPATTWAENLAHDLAGGSRSRKVGSVNSGMPGRPRAPAAAVHGPKIRVVFHQGSGQ